MKVKWFHVYIDGAFHKTVRGREGWEVVRRYAKLAKSQVNARCHDTGEETMLAKAQPKRGPFEMLRALPDGHKLKLTTAGNYPQYPIEGRVCHQPDPSKVVVFVGKFEWLELTAQSDVEFYGENHLHVH